MKHHDIDVDRLLDRTLSEIREESADRDTTQAASDRVWERVLASASAGGAEQDATRAPIRACGDFQRLIPSYLEGGLPRARRALVEDHLGDCLSCRRALKELRTADGDRTPVVARARHWSLGGRGVFAAAAMFVVAVLGVAAAKGLISFDRPATFTVADLDGELIRIGADGTRPLVAGEELTLDGDQRVRAAKGASAVLVLADGSRVEMRERAELAIKQRKSARPWKRSDGLIALKRGNIIVEASKQGSGHLFVETDDCRVAVTGTVFAVNHGTKGSRVSVLEGQVHVSYAGSEEILSPGQQATTRRELDKIPLEQEFAWSLERQKYMAVLNELRELGGEIDAALRPGARTSTDLLDLAPADTAIYVAVPNVGGGLGQAFDLLQDKIATNDVLRQWWQEDFIETGVASHVEQAVETIRSYGDHLGPEITLVLGTGGARGPGEPLFMARLDRPAGFIEMLRDQLGRLEQLDSGFHAAIIEGDLVAPDIAADVSFWVHDDLLVMSPTYERLVQVDDILSGRAATMKGTEFHRRLAEVYHEGAEWFLGMDLERLIDANLGSLEASEGLGLRDVRYLIAERQQTGDRTENRAELLFSGPRRGLAGWLAAPAPMGSLDYISPGTYGAVAFVMKDPSVLVDDLIALAGSADGSFEVGLAEFEREHDIDVREDIAAPLGGEFALALDGPVLPQPSWKLILEVYDPARLQRTIDRLVGQINDAVTPSGGAGFALERETSGGRDYFRVVSVGTELSVHYTFDDGFLLAGPSRAVLERALQNRAVGLGLADAPEFAELLPRDGHVNFSGVMYQNVGPLLGPLGGAASQIAPAIGQGLVGTDLRPGLALLYGEEDRITLVSSSQGGLFTQGILSGMGGLLGVRESLRQVAEQQPGDGD